MLCVVSLLWISCLFHSGLDGDGSLHLLDHGKDLKVGLSHWAVDSVGSAGPSLHRGALEGRSVFECVCGGRASRRSQHTAALCLAPVLLFGAERLP